MAIDTTDMTVDLQFIRAFSHGKDIFYLTFESSGALSAVLERGTFVPALGTLPFANDSENSLGGARRSSRSPMASSARRARRPRGGCT